MPQALRTKADLEREIAAARAELIDIEDHPPMTQHEWADAVRNARARLDAALEAWARQR